MKDRTSVNLGSIVLSEKRRQFPKTTHCVLLFLYHLQDRQSTESESRSAATWAWEERGIKRDFYLSIELSCGESENGPGMQEW